MRTSPGSRPRRCSLVTFALLAVFGACQQTGTTSQSSQTSAGEKQSELIQVGAAQWVTKDSPGRTHAEYYASIDPTDSKRLLACIFGFDPQRNRITSSAFLTENNGANWRLVVDDTAKGTSGVGWLTGDPACEFGPTGDAYFATLPSLPDTLPGKYKPAMHVFTSGDHGRSWGKPLEMPFLDNEDITVDHTDGPYRGRVYLVGQHDPYRGKRKLDIRVNTHRAGLFYSSDSGRTFKGPIDLRGWDSLLIGVIPGAGLVIGNGDMLIPFVTKRPDTVHTAKTPTPAPARQAEQVDVVAVSRVTNGGTTSERPTTVATVRPCYGGPPVLAVDQTNGPFRGRVYVTYTEKGDDVGVYQGAMSFCRIRLAFSEDEGRTWSSPIVVDDAPMPTDTTGMLDAFLPQVAVNDSGVVGISWYDRREDPETGAFRLRFTASIDGGASVMPSVPVAPRAFSYAAPESYASLAFVAPNIIRPGRDSTKEYTQTQVAASASIRVYNQVGDYGRLLAAPHGTFHAFWVDNHDGPQHLYDAAITVKGRAARYGDPSLDSLDVVPSAIQLVYNRSAYDPKTRTVTLGVQLRNTGKTAIAAPIVMRVMYLRSHLGTPLAANADLGGPGGGATWRFTNAGNQLAPGALSEERSLVFRFTDFREARGARHLRGDLALVTFGTQILAPVSGK